MATDRPLPYAESINRLLNSYVKILHARASSCQVDRLPAMGTAMNAFPAGAIDVSGCTTAEQAYKYVFCDRTREGEDMITLYFVGDPPSAATQAAYNYTYQDGVEGDWPRLEQTFIFLRSGWTKGDAVTAPPAASGTGWNKTGEAELLIPDARLHALFVVVEVHYAATGQTRVDYEIDPDTGTLTTITRSWVAVSALPGAATGAAGHDITWKAISSLWTLKTDRYAGSDLDNFSFTVPTRVNIPNMPLELETVEVIWSNQTEEGEFESEWEGGAAGDSASLSGSESANAESSASLLPDIIPTYLPRKAATNLPALQYTFIMDRPVTEVQMLARLTALAGATVLAWPLFKEQTYTIKLLGGKRGVNARVSANESVRISGADVSYDLTKGSGSSFDVSASIATRILGPCINPAISFSGTTTDSVTVDATAAVEWPTGTNWVGVSLSKTATATLDGSVTPDSLSATPVTAVPVTGLYLIGRPEFRQFKSWQDKLIVTCDVLDATILA